MAPCPIHPHQNLFWIIGCCYIYDAPPGPSLQRCRPCRACDVAPTRTRWRDSARTTRPRRLSASDRKPAVWPGENWTQPVRTTSSCCSPLVVPVIRGDVGHGYYRLLFVSFFHYVLYHQSLTTPIFCHCSPFSSHSFQISLTAVLPSHSRSSSPPFPSTFWASHLYVTYSSPILSTWPAHFNLFLANFFLK